MDKSLGLVTNASKDSTDFFLEEFGLEETFDCVVAPPRKVRERVEKRKPHPHMLNKAVECLGSDNPVFLGDSMKDRLAAENAGVEFVKVDGNIASLLKKFN
ncbi:MAG: HAD family hydrolase [Candidatus Nanohaloarchaea archaeon]